MVKVLPILPLTEKLPSMSVKVPSFAKESKKLDEIILDFSKSTNLTDIQAIKLYYGGTEALQDKDKNRFAPVEYISSHRPGGTLAAIPSYSIKCAEVGSSEKVVLKGNYNLFPGVNYFWVFECSFSHIFKSFVF